MSHIGSLPAYRAGLLGTSRNSVVAITTTPIALVAPGSNLYGIHLRSAVLMFSGGASFSVLHAKASAPSAYNDAAAVPILAVNNASQIVLPFPIIISSGLGLYVTGSASTNGYCGITYDLLG